MTTNHAGGGVCDCCGKHRHTLYVWGVNPWDDVVEASICFFCQKEQEREWVTNQKDLERTWVATDPSEGEPGSTNISTGEQLA